MNRPIGMLTADADDLTGTVNDDAFTAPLSAAGVASLQDFDRVDGGEGTDTLSATLDTTAVGDFATGVDGTTTTGVLGTSVSNVENFYLRNLVDASAGVDFDGIDTVEQVWADRVLNDLSAVDLENVVTLGAVRGEDTATNTKSIFNVAYAADVVQDNISAQGRFTQEFALDNANIALDVNAGAAAEVDSGAGSATSATYNFALTGESEVEVQAATLGTALASVLDTITTSGEGSIDLDLGALTGDLTVTLGAGDDTLRLDGTDLDGNDDIDLGAGDNTLIMSGFDGTGTNLFSNLDLSGVDNANALGFSEAGGYAVTNAAPGDDVLDIEDRSEVSFLTGVDAATGGEVLTVETTSSDLALSFAVDSGATATGFAQEVSADVANLTLNVGTAQAGADLTLAGLTNVADTDGNTESLETLTLVNVRDDNETAQSYDITLGGSEEVNGLSTIDLSEAGQQEAGYSSDLANIANSGAGNNQATDSVTLDASAAAFSGPVTIQVGEAELVYGNDEANTLREVFQFVGDEISDMTADAFTITSGGNGDKLDFSQFDGIASIEDLAINQAASNVFEVGAADGQFNGTIQITGTQDIDQSVFEANGFIF